VETYLIIMFLSLGGLVAALVLAAAQARREKAAWLDYREWSMRQRLEDPFPLHPAPRRPLTVIRIDPLELELLLQPPAEETGALPSGVKPSGSHLGTRTHGLGIHAWPEVRV
jgi:hypothetical protein